MLELIETPVFSRQADAVLAEAEYVALQWQLLLWPGSGVLIPGSGGLRKLRWGGAGRGKRGGIRVIDHWDREAARVTLLLLYAKNERDTLTLRELRVLRALLTDD